MTEGEILASERRELCRIHAKRLDNLDEKIVKIDKALYGNGNPKHGILWIATTNKDTIDWIAKLSVGILIITGSNILSKVLPGIVDFIHKSMR